MYAVGESPCLHKSAYLVIGIIHKEVTFQVIGTVGDINGVSIAWLCVIGDHQLYGTQYTVKAVIIYSRSSDKNAVITDIIGNELQCA